MELRDVQNAGSDILDAVSDAIATGNFDNLSDRVRRSVGAITSAAAEGVRQEAAKSSGSGYRQERAADAYVFNEHLKGESAAWRRPDSLKTRSSTKTVQQTDGQKTVSVYKNSSTALADTPFYRQGARAYRAYEGLPMLVGGSVLAAGCGVVTLPLLIVGALTGLPAALATGAVFGAGCAASVFMAKRGDSKRKQMRRYRAYGEAFGDAQYIAIDDLCRYTGIDKETVVRDFKDLKLKGLLPETWVDKNETTLIVSRDSYDQYLSAENARIAREDEEKQIADKWGKSQYAGQVKQILADGDNYLKTVRELNRRIPDAEMTAKISRIEELMDRTFQEIREKPDAAPSLRKYMSYYLPTTIKLLTAYADLDGKPEIGENIAHTKKEISDSLDMVGDGFEKLFDSLFEEMSWDISSDISVMKTMMAQDGLAEDTVVFQNKPQS